MLSDVSVNPNPSALPGAFGVLPFAPVNSIPTLIEWFAIIAIVGGLIRARRGQSSGVAGAARFYAQAASVIGIALGLSGAAQLLNALIGLIDPTAYAGTMSTPIGVILGTTTQLSTGTQTEVDLINAVVLMAAGVGITMFHISLGRRIGVALVGSDGWHDWAVPMVALLFFGVSGFAWLIELAIGAVNGLVTHPSGGVQWGPTLAAAVIYTPAWAWFALRLWRLARSNPVDAVAATV